MSEFKFSFQSLEGEELCILETNVDISEIIQEYRGYYTGSSKGYRNPEGHKGVELIYNDYFFQKSFKVLKTKDNGFEVAVYANKSRKIFSGGGYTGNAGYVDIRRIIGDVLYCLYIGNIIEGKVKKIIINEEEYENIQSAEFVDEDKDKRIIFNTKDGKRVLIPISIDSTESRLSPSSTKGLYILKDEDVFLERWKEQEIKEKGEAVDLFYGKKDNRWGVFFYFNNKLEDLYTINSDNEITICDLKNTFLKRLKSVTYFLDGEAADLNYEYYKELEPDSEKRNTLIKLTDALIKNQKISINKYREDNTIYNLKNIEDADYYTTEISDFLYEFELKVASNEMDAKIECQKLGKIEKDDICIILAATINDWRFQTEKYKVGKKELKEMDTELLPPSLSVPEGYYDNKQKQTIYDLNNIKEYIINNTDNLNTIFGKLKDLEIEKRDILNKNSYSETDKLKLEIKNCLYPAPNIADENVVNEVYEAKVKYDETGKLPNYAIMGGPGTGKSTLAKNIANCLIGAGRDDKEELILYKSTSDLKGAHVGHTGARMYDLIVKASRNKQIIFIDEAYSLQIDQFGKEALEICLPLMTGDRKYIEKPAMRDKPEQTYDFEKEGTKIPPIWFAGYEIEMRKMLSENSGLYRRMKKITLQAPTVEGLYSCLLKKVTGNDMVKKAFENCKNEIRNYFSWAISKENVDYFGNYAGVEDFKETCEIRLKNETNNKFIKEIIIEIIDEKKKEIKRQYKAILEHDEETEFEVQNDIDVILDDVKGNEKIKNNLEDIVDMILHQKDYIAEGIRLPKGALLVGPPGTGKTMLARAVAGEIQKRYRDEEEKNISFAFIATVATELNNSKKIKALFNTADEYDSSIIFIDEIDAIGKERNMEGATPSLLIQLMKEMDGFEERKNTFVMAATNAPELLDPALKRPGRFDRKIEVAYPDKEGRKAILKSALMKLSLFSANKEGAETLAEKLAKETAQYAPANLVNLVNEAAILYKKSNNDSKYRKDLSAAASEEQKFEKDIFETLEYLKLEELNSTRK